MHTRLRAGQSVTRNALSSNPFCAERPSICRGSLDSFACFGWGSLSGVRFSSGITPKCVCCGVKNRVPASIRCMIQFAPFFQFAQQMDADADADAKRMIYKRRWSKQGGIKQRKCSKTITRRRLRRDQEDSTTMSSRQEVWTRGPGSGRC
jgi:hypothetical protein